MEYSEVMLFLLIAVPLLPHIMGNTEEKCYCYSDSDYEAMMAFIDTNEAPPQYKYIGAKVTESDKKEPCYCNDVTIVRTILKVTDPDILDDPALKAINQARSFVEALIPTMEGYEPTLKDRIVNIYVTKHLEDESTPTKYAFGLEFLLKGQDESLKTTVESGFLSSTSLENGHGIQSGLDIMDIDRAMMTYTVPKCSEDPVDTPANGNRDWNNQYLAGGEVVYSCDDGYILEDETQLLTYCDPENETWTAVDPKCVPGCSEDPPTGPVFTVLDWPDKVRLENTEINYPCRKSYRSVDGTKATTKCVNGEWIDIQKSDTFECEEIVCFVNDMPTLPAWAKLTWNGFQSDGTTAVYDCIDGYKPFLGKPATIKCENSVWSKLETNWKCVDNKLEIQSEIEARLERERQAERELDDEERRDKAELEIETNFFLIVTVPSIATLLFVVACCLCCTRTDSPLCVLCSNRYKPPPQKCN